MYIIHSDKRQSNYSEKSKKVVSDFMRVDRVELSVGGLELLDEGNVLLLGLVRALSLVGSPGVPLGSGFHLNGPGLSYHSIQYIFLHDPSVINTIQKEFRMKQYVQAVFSPAVACL